MHYNKTSLDLKVIWDGEDSKGLAQQAAQFQGGGLRQSWGKCDFSAFNFKSLNIEIVMKDSQLLIGIKRYAMQMECICTIPDIFVYSPCDIKVLGTSLLSVTWVTHLSSYFSLFTHSTNIFNYIGQFRPVYVGKLFAQCGSPYPKCNYFRA